MNNMKFLVTGAAGFIGNHVCEKLLNSNAEVIGIDNMNNYYDIKLKEDRINRLNDKNFNFLKLDISDLGKLDKLFSDHNFDFVIHLAAQAGVRFSLKAPQQYIDVNITGFLNIAQCCKKYEVKHLTYASSSSVYGLNSKVPYQTEDSVDHPISIYAATKKTNELFAHTFSHLYDLPTTGLRYFTVYGPWGRPDMAPFIFTKSILNKEPINIFNNGDIYRDFTYIDDVVEATVRISTKPPSKKNNWNSKEGKLSESTAPYKVYNLGNGSPVNVMEFLESIEKITNKKAIKNFVGMQPGDVYKTFADSKELFDIVGFSPKTYSDEGVKLFVDWFKNYYNIS